jgi:hypothetical protein
VVERIIASHCISDEARRNDNIYITAFQDMVVDFCSHGSGDLHSFMKWWDDKGCTRSLSVPDGVDGVRVMTIHKSKGLEFACVHVPLLKGVLDQPDNMMWVPTTGDDGELLQPFSDAHLNAKYVPPMIPLPATTVGKIDVYKHLYEGAQRDERIDRLNQIYVAFTRASRELIVGYAKSSRSQIYSYLEESFIASTADECNKIISEASKEIPSDALIPLADSFKEKVIEPLADAGVPDDSDKSDKQMILTIGKYTVPEEEKTDGDATDVIIMKPYYSLENEQIWDKVAIEDVSDVARPRQEGIALHTVMGYIRHTSDIDRAVLKANMRGVIGRDEMDGIRNMLNKAFDNQYAKLWFDGYKRLLRERSIAVRRDKRDKLSGEVTDVLSHYRPDRVVWTANGEIHVVDFKFGEENPGRYVRQVRGYMNLLRRISATLPADVASQLPADVTSRLSDDVASPSDNKHVKVRGFIWYPQKQEIYEITGDGRVISNVCRK